MGMGGHNKENTKRHVDETAPDQQALPQMVSLQTMTEHDPPPPPRPNPPALPRSPPPRAHHLFTLPPRLTPNTTNPHKPPPNPKPPKTSTRSLAFFRRSASASARFQSASELVLCRQYSSWAARKSSGNAQSPGAAAGALDSAVAWGSGFTAAPRRCVCSALRLPGRGARVAREPRPSGAVCGGARLGNRSGVLRHKVPRRSRSHSTKRERERESTKVERGNNTPTECVRKTTAQDESEPMLDKWWKKRAKQRAAEDEPAGCEGSASKRSASPCREGGRVNAR